MTPSQPSSTAPRPTATTRPSSAQLGEADPVVAGEQRARGRRGRPARRGSSASHSSSGLGRDLDLRSSRLVPHRCVAAYDQRCASSTSQPRSPSVGVEQPARLDRHLDPQRQSALGVPVVRVGERVVERHGRAGAAASTELARRVKPWSARSSQPPSSCGLGRAQARARRPPRARARRRSTAGRAWRCVIDVERDLDRRRARVSMTAVARVQADEVADDVGDVLRRPGRGRRGDPAHAHPAAHPARLQHERHTRPRVQGRDVSQYVSGGPQ